MADQLCRQKQEDIKTKYTKINILIKRLNDRNDSLRVSKKEYSQIVSVKNVMKKSLELLNNRSKRLAMQTALIKDKIGEGGVIPADIISEKDDESTFVTLAVNIEPPVNIQPPAPVALNNNTAVNVVSAAEQSISPPITEEILTPETKSARNSLASFTEKISGIKSNFNRAEIVKAINQMGLLTYKVCSVKINNYSYR